MTNTPAPNLEGGFASTPSPLPEQSYAAAEPLPDLATPITPAVLSPEIPPLAPQETTTLDQAQMAIPAPEPMIAPLPDQLQDLPQQSPPLPQPQIAPPYPAQNLAPSSPAQVAQPSPPPAMPEQIIESPATLDNPALAQDITRVEASEQPPADPDEPSAVYDEATGELNIIHHRGGAPRGSAA